MSDSCDPMDCCSPGSSVHGILQARILEWVAMASSRGSSWPRDRTHVSLCLLHWQARSLPLVPPGTTPTTHFTSTIASLPLSVCSVTQLCSIHWNPMHCSPPGFPVHGISQARKLEWVSRGSFRLRNWIQAFCIAGRFFINWATQEVKIAAELV